MEERELPVGWVDAPLLGLGELIRGVTYSKNDSSDRSFSGSIPILRANNIQDRHFDTANLVHVPTSLVAQTQIVKAGDVVIATSSGSISVVGKAAQAREDFAMAFGAFCGLIRPSNEISPEYFGHFFSSEYYRTAVSDMARGVNINNLKKSHFESLNIPLPPLNEQHRIAAKLDTTLAAVDACRQRLDGVAAILKRFRQAVLAAATSGELTREWREEAGAPGWIIEKSAAVCAKVQSGGTPKEGFIDEPGIPFLKVYNLVNQKVAFDYKPQFVRPEIHLGALSKSRVHPGDVLMNIVGPPLGKIAIAPDDHDEWNINQAITLFRPSERLKSKWIYYLLCEGSAIREIELRTKGSAGQVNISLSQCRDFDFLIPSIEEQEEIIGRVEMFFTLADQLEARLTAARKVVDRLTPALLAKAFRGELVPQDPNDEPASVLLERIRAARQAEAATGKPSRRGRPKAAANPASSPVDAAPVTPDRLATLLRECGALSERALLAASELDPAGFRAQLAHERSLGAIGNLDDDGQELLEAVG